MGGREKPEHQTALGCRLRRGDPTVLTEINAEFRNLICMIAHGFRCFESGAFFRELILKGQP